MIHSILDQTFEDFELIIVDDGSTDNTHEEVKKFLGAEADRIKYYLLPHTGKIGKVRNYGIQKCRGELVVVQDSDDISLPDRLSTLWDEYIRTGADVLYHSVYWCFPIDGIILRKYKEAEPYDKQRIIYTQYIPAHIAAKRDCFLQVPYDEEVLVSDDWLLLIEFAMAGFTFHNIHRSLYEYWYSLDSININGEREGKRRADMAYITKLLKKKYGLTFTAETVQTENGKILKHETIQ
jgi:glycosyltransferase involved in cell wall biosynthesis